MSKRWHDGGFDRALNAAVRSGEIEELPEGFYRERAPRRTPRATGQVAER